jgi:hypothetical protein
LNARAAEALRIDEGDSTSRLRAWEDDKRPAMVATRKDSMMAVPRLDGRVRAMKSRLEAVRCSREKDPEQV